MLVTAARRRPVAFIACCTSARLAPADTVRGPRVAPMAQWRHQSLAISDVVTFHDTPQVPGRADDERGMHMIIAEELLYLPDGSRQRMPGRDREHRIADGAHDLIHRLRIIKTPPSTPGSARPRLPSAAQFAYDTVWRRTRSQANGRRISPISEVTFPLQIQLPSAF